MLCRSGNKKYKNKYKGRIKGECNNDIYELQCAMECDCGIRSFDVEFANAAPSSDGEEPEKEDVFENFTYEKECNCEAPNDIFKIDEEDIDKMREAQKPALKELQETEEFCETNYFGQPDPYSHKNEVKKSYFWVDYAMNILNSGKSNLFLSKNFIDIDDSFIGIMGVFALLDLPISLIVIGFMLTSFNRGSVVSKFLLLQIPAVIFMSDLIFRLRFNFLIFASSS